MKATRIPKEIGGGGVHLVDRHGHGVVGDQRNKVRVISHLGDFCRDISCQGFSFIDDTRDEEVLEATIRGSNCGYVYSFAFEAQSFCSGIVIRRGEVSTHVLVGTEAPPPRAFSLL